MGYYITTTTSRNKALAIQKMGGIILASPPESYESIPADKALIVVIDNGMFEAAGLVYSPGEFQAFVKYPDHRHKEFVLLNKELAYNLAGYSE